jgi:hypothetical protein
MMDTKEMEAGREINELVAEKVFGWRWWRYQFGQYTEAREQNYAKIVVRSIQPPTFPPEDWRAWGEENGLAPAEGTEPLHQLQGLGDAGIVGDLPNYSGPIAAAKLVVDSMRQRGYTVELLFNPAGDECNMSASGNDGHIRRGAVGTMAEQICLAALACVDAEQERA